MEPGSSSGPPKKPESVRTGKRLGSMLQNIEPFVARTDHNPVELRTWAKRTGYVSTTFSLDRNASSSDRTDSSRFDLEKGADQIGGSSEIDPIHGRTKLRRVGEIEPVLGSGNKRENAMDLNIIRNDNQSSSIVDEASLRRDRDKEKKDGLDRNGHANGNGGDVKDNSSSVNGIEGGRVQPLGVEPLKKDDANADGGPEMYGHPYSQEPSPDLGWSNTRLELRCGLRDKPGVVPAIYYGLQHYLSLAGSLIFIPLIIVPIMGGSDKDVATVISTMFMVTGITTLINSYFGTRLPLVQGSSFVYLAPALVIMNARDFRNLSEHKFKHIMRELQGAIIIGSIFQCILGLTGLMSLFLRLINPVVVAPCIAAVGLAFFSYGFPQAGECVEISLPVILLVLVFALYLRGISIFGHRIFRIYAVPLSIVIIWAYAFFLTAGGAYNYKGCSPDIPTSNILLDSCRRHVNTMKSCRTDVSNAWKTAAWIRVPYPLQWGIPVFHLRTSLIMIFVSLVASVDSVGIYHSTSMLVSSHPPTPVIVSRGIAVEGFCSILAGLWGSGTGSTTLTENIHTIRVTRVANRSAVEVGALFFIFFSFIGKVGAILASIPLSLAAAMLCFIWALIVALGLSNLQYGTASFRNMTVVGVSLFLGLSIPAYFQQYQPQTLFMLPSYLIPYSAASDGPVSTGNRQIDFAINGLMSMNMVVTLLVALILDNSVPGSKEERGVYKWSRRDDLANDPSLLQDYSLPRRVARVFCWSRCLGG